MATNDLYPGIVDSWSLMAFARGHGKMQVGTFINKKTNEVFKSCIFTDGSGDRCFVNFSSNLGELTPSQISEKKNELQVVELESGNYVLCRQGNSGWKDVEL